MTDEQTTKTPRERFLSVAPGRVQKVLDALDHLAKCGNETSYEFEEVEVETIEIALKLKIAETLDAFQPAVEAPKFAFTVSEPAGQPLGHHPV